MSLRRVLRLLGLLMLLVGLGSLVLLVVPGPTQVADWMGRCRTDFDATSDCDTIDAIEFLLSGTGTLIVVGGLLAIALRPEGAKPITLNLRWVGRLLRLGRGG